MKNLASFSYRTHLTAPSRVLALALILTQTWSLRSEAQTSIPTPIPDPSSQLAPLAAAVSTPGSPNSDASIPIAPAAAAQPAGAAQPVPALAFSPLVPTTPLADADWLHTNYCLQGLAGLKCPGVSTTPVAPWETTPEWKSYAAKLENQWGDLDRMRLSAMRTWALTHVESLRSQARVLFYPFSGPDFLYADNFFPNAKYIVMAGLEPVGVMPDLAQLQTEGKLAPFLTNLDTSLKTILLASFFKTKDMKVDFSAGLLPALAVFIGREGYSIDNIDYVHLGKDGILQPRKAQESHNGVQITYFGKDRKDTRVLLYFSVDLGNDGVKANPGYINLMQRMAPGVTYLKAASYLLHEDYFSTMRKALLENSVGVLEDDSGLPLRAFGPDWKVTALGTYTGPISLFKTEYQPDMKTLFDQQKPAPLPFGSGYKFHASESSLLLAEKTTAGK